MKTNRSLNRKELSILMEMLLITCFGENPEEVLSSKSWQQIFGYNMNTLSEEDQKQTINKMFGRKDRRLKFSSRLFANEVKLYNSGGQHFNISDQALANVCKFIGNDTLEDVIEAFFSQRKIDPKDYEGMIPESIKFLPPIKGRGKSKTKSRLENQLDNLNGDWYYFTHDHQSDPAKSKILGLPLTIKKNDNSGETNIRLFNTDPYISFRGKIVKNHSNDNIIVCELTSFKKTNKKPLFLVFHVDLSADKDTYIGGYLRFSENAAIRMGTVVLRRRNENDPFDPENFEATKDNEKVPPLIKEFLSDRYLNMVKVPRGIYSDLDLNNWLKEKRKLINQYKPVHDLYVGMLGIPHNFQQTKQQLQKEVLSIMKALTQTDKKLNEYLNFKTLPAKISSIIDELQPTSKADFENHIREMIERLRSLNIGYKDIYYSEINEEKRDQINMQILLKRQLNVFVKSKDYLFVLPDPKYLTNILVQIGWLMIQSNSNKKAFIFYSGELPQLVREATTLKNQNIFITSLDHIGGIKGIPDFLANPMNDVSFL